MVVRTCLRELVRGVGAIAAAFLLCGLLLQIGTGNGVDERELDPRFGAESRAAIRQEAEGRGARLLEFGRRAWAGDFGESTILGRPVIELVRERLPRTAFTVGIAWVVTLLLSVGLAVGAASGGRLGTERWLAFSTALMLAIPAAVLALISAHARLPVAAVIVIAVLPQAYRYAWGIVSEIARSGFVLAARARGIGRWRLGTAHIALPAAPELFGISSLTLNLALGAAIPIEALTGDAGLGNLVWQAALGRDVHLIVALTLLISVATLAASSAAEIGAAAIRARRLQ